MKSPLKLREMIIHTLEEEYQQKNSKVSRISNTGTITVEHKSPT